MFTARSLSVATRFFASSLFNFKDPQFCFFMTLCFWTKWPTLYRDLDAAFIYINIFIGGDVEKAERVSEWEKERERKREREREREREIPSRAFYGLRSPEASRKRPDEIGSTTTPTRVPRLMLSLSLSLFLPFPFHFFLLCFIGCWLTFTSMP